jgi:probable FeS assembly SUF system protein SufT
MMRGHEPITLTRDCQAVQIPYGTPITLPAGSRVIVTQALGGSFTVTTDQGYLARIAGVDADAIGEEPITEETATVTSEGADLVKQVWDQLRTLYDPEIPVNVVDLGLIYDCAISPLPDGGHRVEVKMTLTAPGCGMGDFLRQDAQDKLLRLPGVKEAQVQVVFDPPWDRRRMTEAAKLQLGMYDD